MRRYEQRQWRRQWRRDRQRGSPAGLGGSGPGGGSGGSGPGGSAGRGTGAGGGPGGAIGSGGGPKGSGGAVGASGRTGAGGQAGRTGAGGTSATGGSTGGTTGGNGPQVWVSPTGSDTNVDTQAAPFLTIQHAHGAITAGGTIWVMPGTYRYDRTVNLSLAGSANNVTRLWAVPGGARPVIDFSQQARDTSSNRGFTIPGSFWHLKGFEVKNAGDNCINISGSNNTVEWWRQTAAMTRGFDNNFMGNCDMHMFKMYAQTVYAVHAILAMRCTPSWVPAPAPAGTDRRHPGDNRGGS